jgi:RNA ligase (TIGR02306 family)
MTTSSHKAEVVFINEIEDIPGADFIGLVQVWGFPCVLRKEDFEKNDRKLWLYLPPDSLVPTSRKEFKFLDDGSGGYQRIKVRKYKKQRSFGLLVAAPSGAKEGDDYASKWKIEHYEPQVKAPTPPKGGFKGKYLNRINKLSRRFGEKPPKIVVPYYDIEALRRYPNVFTEDDEVVVTEKIHGSQAIWCWEDRGWTYSLRWWLSHRLWKSPPKLREESRFLRVRSRKVWRPPVGNYWADACPEGVREMLEYDDNLVVFGEIYGQGIQELTYNEPEPKAAIFDILSPDGWLQWDTVKFLGETWGFDTVPELYRGPYDFETIEKLAEGKTTLNNGPHVREGVVVRCANDEKHPRFGRKQLKLVGWDYYNKGK